VITGSLSTVHHPGHSSFSPPKALDDGESPDFRRLGEGGADGGPEGGCRFSVNSAMVDVKTELGMERKNGAIVGAGSRYINDSLLGQLAFYLQIVAEAKQRGPTTFSTHSSTNKQRS